jgi:hypothetical protein
MIEVVPPEWRFLLLGSPDTITLVNRSAPVRRYVWWGKLWLGTIKDENVGMLDRDGKGVAGEEIGIDELHNRLLTNASFYQHKLNWRGADFDVSR